MKLQFCWDQYFSAGPQARGNKRHTWDSCLSCFCFTFSQEHFSGVGMHYDAIQWYYISSYGCKWSAGEELTCLEGKRNAVLAQMFFSGQSDSADPFSFGSTGETCSWKSLYFPAVMSVLVKRQKWGILCLCSGNILCLCKTYYSCRCNRQSSLPHCGLLVRFCVRAWQGGTIWANLKLAWYL